MFKHHDPEELAPLVGRMGRGLLAFLEMFSKRPTTPDGGRGMSPRKVGLLAGGAKMTEGLTAQDDVAALSVTGKIADDERFHGSGLRSISTR